MKVRAFLNTEKHSSDDGVCKLCVLFWIRQGNGFLLRFYNIQLKTGWYKFFDEVK